MSYQTTSNSGITGAAGSVFIQPKTERPASHLDDICMKLDGVIAEFTEIVNRLDQAAIRSIGPEAEKIAQSNPAPPPIATLGLINNKIEHLVNVASWLRGVVSKIERIL